MVVEPLLITMTIEFRADINNLERKVKVASKKAANWKKRLSKVQKVHVGATKEVDHLSMKIRWGDKAHAIERVDFVT